MRAGEGNLIRRGIDPGDASRRSTLDNSFREDTTAAANVEIAKTRCEGEPRQEFVGD